MRKLSCGLVLLLMMLVPAAKSEGAPILFDFTVNFTSGPLSGQSRVGSFSVDGDDCPGGICQGVFTPNWAPLTLLSFDITIDGFAFDITKDEQYPSFPGVGFTAGTVTFMSYQPHFSSPFFEVHFNSGQNVVHFMPAPLRTSDGFIANVEPQAVPEPATLTLLAGGVAATVLRRRRKQRA